MDGLGDGDGMGFDMQPMMMNQQPQLFGAYPQDSSQMGMSAESLYPDDSLAAGEDANDAKRRRIARVRNAANILAIKVADREYFWSRPAICVGRRKSSATANCPSVRTASTTRRIVSSRKSRRNEILPKGR